MTESKSVALPLGYIPTEMVGRGGFEPPNRKELSYSQPRLATSLPPRIWCRLKDLNPQPTDYKSVALPIELSRQKYNQWWLETESNRPHEDFQSSALPTELSSPFKKLAVPTGIEPAISCVTGRHVNRYTTGPFLVAGTGFEPATFGL